MFKPRGHSARKSRRRSKKPLGFSTIFVISFIIFSLFTVWGLFLINEGIKPTLVAFAMTKTKNVATTVTNVAINKQLKELQQNVTFETLEKDSEGKISAVIVHTANVAMLETTTTNQVLNYLKRLEHGTLEEYLNSEGIEVETRLKGPMIATVPLGLAARNSLLANLGPQIPVRFQVIGNVTSAVKEKSEYVGIDTIHYRLYIKIKVSVRTIIPFATKLQTVTGEIPVVNVTFPADVPLYYGGRGNGSTPSFVLPSQKEEDAKKNKQQ